MSVITPVCMIIFNDSSEVLLIKRLGDDTWSLPGDVPKARESYEDALSRSVSEQLRCRVKCFDYYKSSYFEENKQEQYRSVYYAGSIDGDLLLGDAVSDSKWVHWRQLASDDVRLYLDQKDTVIGFFNRTPVKKSFWSFLFRRPHT
ncbi:NUDIX domain-containing protein [Candidatus Woesearchaeota archaeon]|nr:NUDIX domain-containing protein [Candidatus Woesearchaeota archaeon]